MAGVHETHQSKSDIITAAIRAAAISASASTPKAETTPFITISREAGTGAHRLARRLVNELNHKLYKNDRQWETLDHETMEMLVGDQKLSAAVMESLEQTDHSWFGELLEGLPGGDHSAPSQLQVFHHTAAAIRTLAQAGRIVLVGGGAAYITHGMPGGVHVRLVAPKDYRIDSTAKAENLLLSDAAAKVDRLDHNRAAFFRRHWPDRPLASDQFTMTLNVAELTEDQMAAAILAVVNTR